MDINKKEVSTDIKHLYNLAVIHFSNKTVEEVKNICHRYTMFELQKTLTDNELLQIKVFNADNEPLKYITVFVSAKDPDKIELEPSDIVGLSAYIDCYYNNELYEDVLIEA